MKQKRYDKREVDSGKGASKISLLPIEVLTIVCKFLPLNDLKSLQGTNKCFCYVVRTVRWNTLAFKKKEPVRCDWVDGVESSTARVIDEHEALYPLNDYDTKLRFESEVAKKVEKNICVRWADFSEFLYFFERTYADKVERMIRRIVIEECSMLRIEAVSRLLTLWNMPNLTRVEVSLISNDLAAGYPEPSQLVDSLLGIHPNVEVMARLHHANMCLSQCLRFAKLTVLTLTSLTEHIPTLPPSILRLTLAFSPLNSLNTTVRKITVEALTRTLWPLSNLVDLSIKNAEVTNESSVNWIPSSVRFLNLCCFDRVLSSESIVRFITACKMCKDGPQFIFPNLTSLYLLDPFTCPSRRLQTIQWNTWGEAEPFPKLRKFVCSHWMEQWSYIQYVTANSRIDRLSFLEVDTTLVPPISRLPRASEIKYVAIQCRHTCRYFKRRLFKELARLEGIKQVYLVTPSPYCPWFCSRVRDAANLPVDTAYHSSHNVFKVNLQICRNCNPRYWGHKFKRLWVPPEDEDHTFIYRPEIGDW
ncbi:hypothetical protein TRICI_003684 [Trichomonascus ciferrii]|uniref:F-box domain-containing protein n=1 Tax=Trichomonascus ciferrii TaxID=44093 RepID=A0A642V881_9ASCO|nr:hypothetical protein TRICI_003684 [Trichomonascus ciferrii]